MKRVVQFDIKKQQVKYLHCGETRVLQTIPGKSSNLTCRIKNTNQCQLDFGKVSCGKLRYMKTCCFCTVFTIFDLFPISEHESLWLHMHHHIFFFLENFLLVCSCLFYFENFDVPTVPCMLFYCVLWLFVFCYFERFLYLKRIRSESKVSYFFLKRSTKATMQVGLDIFRHSTKIVLMDIFQHEM